MQHLKQLIVFLIIISMCITPTYARTNKKKIAKSEVKWIFIGDSYSAYGQNTKIPELLVKKIKLKKKEYETFCHGGYGFAATCFGEKATFTSLIKYEKTNKNVKNVLVIGGIGNDIRTNGDETSITDAMNRFFELVKEKYPNAIIWYAMPNWSANTTNPAHPKGEDSKEWQKKITEIESVYIKNCALNGVQVLKRTRTCLRFNNNRKYFIDDLHHPSLKGRKLIAESIYKDITNSNIYKQQIKTEKAQKKLKSLS